MAHYDEQIDRAVVSLEVIADALHDYISIVHDMGLDDPETVVFVKKSIEKAREDFNRELQEKPSYFQLEFEAESLRRKVTRLEEQLEEAYADLSDKDKDKEDY